jgi:hypothetical protein
MEWLNSPGRKLTLALEAPKDIGEESGPQNGT